MEQIRKVAHPCAVCNAHLTVKKQQQQQQQESHLTGVRRVATTGWKDLESVSSQSVSQPRRKKAWCFSARVQQV